MFQRITILAVSLLMIHTFVLAQTSKTTLDIEEVLEMAKDYSPQAILAKHQFRAAYWQYRTYKAELLPSVTFSGTLPNFKRDITRQWVDGSYKYVEDNSNLLSAGLGVNQNIGLTGGRIFAQSSLDRSDIFSVPPKTQYMSTPASIGFSQPLFGFNKFKWSKKIEPLKYLEAKRLYIETMENISGLAIGYFFDLVLAQQNLKTAMLNYANTDTLYQIAKGRYNIGTIAENELLQMELSYLNAGSSVNESEIDLQRMKFRLKSFLGIKNDYDLELVVPNYFPKTSLKYDAVLTYAKTNNPQIIEFQRRILEADRNVAQAKADRGFKADLYASFGLAKESEEFNDLYADPREKQQVNIGIQIPILDWGLGKGRVKMAESSREVVRTNIQQSLTDFEQDIFLKVMRFNLQETQLQLAVKADAIAQSRYNVTKERFLIGKIDVIELNIAQTERDNARGKYISAMRNYWQFYYDMRKLTQYNFIDNKPIEAEFEALLK